MLFVFVSSIQTVWAVADEQWKHLKVSMRNIWQFSVIVHDNYQEGAQYPSTLH